MARTRAPATAEAAFLAPLAKLAAKDEDGAALVFWANPGWDPAPTEEMDAGEIAFYAEGLIPEGFHLEWRAVAVAGETSTDHLRLYVWEAEAESPPPEAADWRILASGRWPA